MVHAPTAKVQDFPGCLNTHKCTSFQHNPWPHCLLPKMKGFLGRPPADSFNDIFPFYTYPYLQEPSLPALT